ncbi:MAG: AhpC/TSA family protein [Bacteroidales bacterium]|nr:AhpC/TSA family protein [Candidatus Physcousia equi]
MKQRIFLTAMASFAMLSATAQKPCKIDAELVNGASTEKVYIFIQDEKGDTPQQPTDSVVLKKGKFSYKANLTGPRVAYFTATMSNGKPMQMQTLLVPGESAKITFDERSYFIDGSKFYAEWNAADKVMSESAVKLSEFVSDINARLSQMSEEERNEKLPALRAEFEAKSKERSKLVSDYFDAHKGDEGCVAYYALIMNDDDKAINESSEEVKNGRIRPFLEMLREKIKAQMEAYEKARKEAEDASSATGEGKMFVDFEAEYDGKVQKLSDYVGKGKYVLVDFWASWCGPCKAEIPNLIEIYNKYKGDKFEVLGVATWDQPAATLKSIEQLGIPYPQILNAQKAGSDAYGILGIPQIILFGPDGTILKRNLRGSAIEELVQKCLEK